ncbi:hypothetical protein EVAR_19100_1 [Eumeta japonica]|uniref:Uncharacterized protein n=1 Tax=Eumeta variegata TaxID=151549 RepID=A0A4C1UP56_EUMVA|nr:hypothetical protein EVAR_19100_1 [Eumeta japonica]
MQPDCAHALEKCVTKSNAILTKKTRADYDRHPLIYAERVIRETSLENWLERYTEGSTSEVTKCFFLRMEIGCKVLRKTEKTSHLAQEFMGHGWLGNLLIDYRLLQNDIPSSSVSKMAELLSSKDVISYTYTLTYIMLTIITANECPPHKSINFWAQDDIEGTGIARESLPGLVSDSPIVSGEGEEGKFPYRRIGSFRFGCSDEVRHPLRLVPRRCKTRAGEVRFARRGAAVCITPDERCLSADSGGDACFFLLIEPSGMFSEFSRFQERIIS